MYPLYLQVFNKTSIFSRDFRKLLTYKIPTMRAELFQADGWTD